MCQHKKCQKVQFEVEWLMPLRCSLAFFSIRIYTHAAPLALKGKAVPTSTSHRNSEELAQKVWAEDGNYGKHGNYEGRFGRRSVRALFCLGQRRDAIGKKTKRWSFADRAVVRGNDYRDSGWVADWSGFAGL
jgi:hypothetical protein